MLWGRDRPFERNRPVSALCGPLVAFGGPFPALLRPGLRLM